MRKKNRNLIIGCLVIPFLLVIVLIVVFDINLNRTPVGWMKYYSNLSIPNDAEVIENYNHSFFSGECETYLILAISKEQMKLLIEEAKIKSYLPLPIPKKQSVRGRSEVTEKYKQSTVKGCFWFYRYPQSRCTKLIILDEEENTIIVNFKC